MGALYALVFIELGVAAYHTSAQQLKISGRICRTASGQTQPSRVARSREEDDAEYLLITYQTSYIAVHIQPKIGVCTTDAGVKF